jgi:hypothetical protein
MKKIDEMLIAARANPVRFLGWTLLLLVIVVAGYTVGESLGHELYLYTH